MRKKDEIRQECNEIGRLHYKNLALGMLITFLSIHLFFPGLIISILGITLDLSIEWRLAGLMLVIIAIGCLVAAIFFLRKASYWNEQWCEKVFGDRLEPWERELMERWRRTCQE